MEDMPAFMFQADALQCGAARFFDQELFSDVVLVAPGGRRLAAHRVILSACSRPFAAALASGLPPGGVLPVTGVDSDALEAVVRYFYEGRLLLTPRNAVPVLDAAQRLQVDAVSDAALGYVRGALTGRSAVRLLSEALRYDLEDLADECAACAAANFDEATRRADFLAAPAPAAARVLSAARAAGARGGRALFAAAWQWLTADTEHVQHLEELLRAVASPDLTLEDLVGVSGLGSTAAAAAAAAAAPHFGAAALVLEQLVSAWGAAGGGGAGAAPPPPEPPEPPAPAPRALPLALSAAAAAPAAAPPAAEGGGGGGSLQHLLNALLQAGAATGGAPGAHELAAALASAAAAASGAAPGGLPPALQSVAAAVAAGAGAGAGAPQLPALAGAGPFDGDPGDGPPLQAKRSVEEPPVPIYDPYASAAAAGFGGGGGAAPSPRGSDAAAPGAAAGAAAGGSPAAAGEGGAAEQEREPWPAGRPWRAAKRRALDGFEPEEADARPAGGRARSGSAGAAAAAAAAGPQEELPRMRPRSGARSYSAVFAVAKAPQGVKGVCQVDGCGVDLTELRDYHQRYRICEEHIKASAVPREGKTMRFCQQCGRLHPLADFDGSKRSCRARLQRHNERRRKRGGDEPPPLGGGSGGGGGGSDDGGGAGRRGSGAAAGPWGLDALASAAEEGADPSEPPPAPGDPRGDGAAPGAPGGAGRAARAGGSSSDTRAPGAPGEGEGEQERAREQEAEREPGSTSASERA